jgi:putative oxidoreductase
MTRAARPTRLPVWLPGAMHSLLRLITGLLFMEHGVQKLFGLLADPSHPWNGPPPAFSLFWVAGVLETFGGFLLAIGLLTRPVAFLLAGEMAVAYFKVHFHRSFWPVLNGGEHTVLYCFIFLYMFAAGGGTYGVDAALARQPADADKDTDLHAW